MAPSKKTPTPSKGSDQPRHGKWTKEEEAYVDLLIEEFRCGALPLREGTTLRCFLSKMINCNPKRVSKKYENTNYNGKHKYQPSTTPMSMEEMKRRRERLQEHEQRFLQALERSEDELCMDEDALMNTTTATTTTTTTTFPSMKIEEQDTQFKKKIASSETAKRPSLVVDQGFQARLKAELQCRMDLANMGGSGRGGVDLRDISLSNTANLSLPLPHSFAASASNRRSSLHQLSSFELMASLKPGTGNPRYNPNNGTTTTMGVASSGQPNIPGEDDHLGWQMRLQRRATAEGMGLSSFSADQCDPFPLPPYLRHQSNLRDDTLQRVTTNETPFPNLPTPEHRSRLMAGMEHLSHLHFATLMGQRQPGTSNPGASSSLGGTVARRSSILSELEMMESLKRDRHQDAMDSFRPFKRFR